MRRLLQPPMFIATDPELADSFAPGLDPDIVRGVLTDLGLAAHPDLVAWWSWHDGVRSTGWWPQFSLVSVYWPMPLAVAVKEWRWQVGEWDPQNPLAPSSLPGCGSTTARRCASTPETERSGWQIRTTDPSK